MEKMLLHNAANGTSCRLSVFRTEGGVSECHAMIEVEPLDDGFSEQLRRIRLAEQELQRSMPGMDGAKCVFKRYFLSDPTNQQPQIDEQSECTVSYIGQPPLGGSKVALWVYYVGAEAAVVYKADELGSTVVRFGDAEHVWTMGLTRGEGTSYEQTWRLIQDYERLLQTRYSASMEANCVRTWFFVRDVDTQYKGLVVARRELFERMGMTAQTHYIASTCIGGNPAETAALVQLGGYAMTGSVSSRYLYAPTHLNRTSEYGVTFERGVLVNLRDRQTAYISGTASINNKGEVVHVGDVRAQTLRMWENVDALLTEAGMTFEDVMQIVVYLRDIADYGVVKGMFAERFPTTPYIITLAPVCRPTWLVEMECIAVK